LVSLEEEEVLLYCLLEGVHLFPQNWKESLNHLVLADWENIAELVGVIG
jgi:hypothetical protein